jgi:ribosome-interacting GTPase 1
MAAFADLEVRLSVLDESSLDAFRAVTWRLTGLIRVRLRSNGTVEPEPVALEPGSTVADVADWVHHDLAATFVGARVWGVSARFDGQRVGRSTPSRTATSWRSCDEAFDGTDRDAGIARPAGHVTPPH